MESPVMAVAALVIGLFGTAAAVLFIGERAARLIGSRNVAILLLGIVPFAVSIGLTAINWKHLALWQRLVYPLSGPPLMVAVLFLGFAAINPADALLLIGTLLCRGWELVSSAFRRGRRDT